MEAPVDLIDQLGGWSLPSVGQSNGDGYLLNNLKQQMIRISSWKLGSKNSRHCWFGQAAAPARSRKL